LGFHAKIETFLIATLFAICSIKLIDLTIIFVVDALFIFTYPPSEECSAGIASNISIMEVGSCRTAAHTAHRHKGDVGGVIRRTGGVRTATVIGT